MLKLNGDAFHRATLLLTAWSLFVPDNDYNGSGELGLINLDETFKSDVLHEIVWLRGGLGVLGCLVADKRAAALENDIHEGVCTWKMFRDGCKDISSRMKDEISMSSLFLIDTKYSSWFNTDHQSFGKIVAEKFETIAFEVDEAAKCLAFGRSTACVFHTMRTMEVAVKALSKCLCIEDPLKSGDRNWGAMLKKIKTGIDSKWPEPKQRISGDAALFESLYASLDAVKNPWRNATMHVENKYTEDEAEHIFTAAKGFLQRLASRIDEEGLPLA